MSQKFITAFINEQIKLTTRLKGQSLFDKALVSVLSEEEVVVGTQTSSPNGMPSQVPTNEPAPQNQPPEKETTLPPENADIEIKLAKLAAVALFTDVEKILSKHEGLRPEIIQLSKLKDSGLSGREESLKTLKNIVKVVKLGGNELNFDIDQDFINKFDSTVNDTLTNLVIKVLFISKDNILQKNDSLRTVMDSIGSLLAQLKPVENADPVAASDIAKQIVQKINSDILPSADLTI